MAASTIQKAFTIASRARGLPTKSVWTEFTPLATKHGAINLGQGFPDFEAPPFVLEAGMDAISRHINQYTRPQGHVRLCNAIAQTYNTHYKSVRDIDPMQNVVTTVGASEAITLVIQALIEPGDEVIIIEPYYDTYPLNVLLADGKPVFVPLKPQGKIGNDWVLDVNELEKAVTPKTKMLIVNNPQNIPGNSTNSCCGVGMPIHYPGRLAAQSLQTSNLYHCLQFVGKVYNQTEIAQLAKFAIRHNLFVLSDEVYDSLVFDGQQPNSNMLALYPGMLERTVTLGSSGKKFMVTGWKIGWAIGPEVLATAMNALQQTIPFCISTPLQEAVAISLEKSMDSDYYVDMAKRLEAKRNLLCDGLEKAGLKPYVPQGTYFVVADFSGIDPALYAQETILDPQASKDFHFCRWLTKEIGVAAIPTTAFVSPPHREEYSSLARFCFGKKDETLLQAIEKLQKLKNRNENCNAANAASTISASATNATNSTSTTNTTNSTSTTNATNSTLANNNHTNNTNTNNHTNHNSINNTINKL